MNNSSNKPDNAPVHMDVNGVKGVAIQPFEGPTLELISLTEGRKKAMMIDLAATPQMAETIKKLREAGIEVAAYRDHHYAPQSLHPRDQETVKNAEAIKAELGEKARFEPRENAPSCARLIELGEAIREKIDLILHHGDTDGFLGYLKAVGVSYEGMDSDADILDSRGDESQLTEHGKLYRDALISVPAFDKARPDISNKAKEQLQKEFVAYIESNFSGEAAKPLREKAKAAQEMEKTMEELMDATEVLPGGIVFVDTTVVGARKYDVKKLSDIIEKIPGARLTAQKKNTGPLAKDGACQISIARMSTDKETDLRKYLPEGAESGVEHGRIFNTPFLLHLREDLFEDFKTRFIGQNGLMAPFSPALRSHRLWDKYHQHDEAIRARAQKIADEYYKKWSVEEGLDEEHRALRETQKSDDGKTSEIRKKFFRDAWEGKYGKGKLVLTDENKNGQRQLIRIIALPENCNPKESETDHQELHYLIDFHYNYVPVHNGEITKKELDDLFLSSLDQQNNMPSLIAAFPPEYKPPIQEIKVGRSFLIQPGEHHSGSISGKIIKMPTGRFGIISYYNGERSENGPRIEGVVPDILKMEGYLSARCAGWGGTPLSEPTPEEKSYLEAVVLKIAIDTL